MSNYKDKLFDNIENSKKFENIDFNIEDNKIEDIFINDILKSDHPFKIITEFCNKFKVSPIVKVVEVIKPISQFLTKITVFNNLVGEGKGTTKKKSKKDASINLLINILNDNFLSIQMKKFLKGDIIDLCIDNVMHEEVNFDYNPLSKLNDFKNNTGKDYKFYYSTESSNKNEIIHIAHIYVESNLMGTGKNLSMKKAKLIAADNSLKKLKKIYGDEVLMTKLEKKQYKKELISKIENKINLIDSDSPSKYINKDVNNNTINLLSENTNNNIDLSDFNQYYNCLLNNIEKNIINVSLQKNFEIYSILYDRFVMTSPNQFELEYILNKINFPFINKTKIVGSCLYNSMNIKNNIIDLVLTYTNQIDIHKLKNELELKFFDSNVFINIHKIDDHSFDLKLRLDTKYYLNLIVRNESEYNEFLKYISLHETYIINFLKNNFDYKYNFTILKRLIRAWRRRRNELFNISTELLDWIIAINLSNSISESLVKSFNMIGYNFTFKNKDIPEYILNQIKNISNQNNLCKLAKESIDFIINGKFEYLYI